MSRVSIHLFGPFQTFLNGVPLENFKSDKARALLAYLAVESEQPHSRTKIAGYLWPQMSDTEALANLRFTLSSLRHTLKEKKTLQPVLSASRGTLQFNPLSDAWVDVTFFEQQLAYAAELSPMQALSYLTAAAQCYRGEFLEGFYLPGCSEFDDWLLLTRERLTVQSLGVMHTLTEFYKSRRQWEQALTYTQRALELAPWDENLHQQAMRLLAHNGDTSAALAQYRSCKRLLTEVFQVPISAETRKLADKIKAGEPVPVITTTPQPSAARPGGQLCLARETELAQLAATFQESTAGHGQTIFVRGKAGSGKSTLLKTFIGRALGKHPDLLVAWGECSNLSATFALPLQPFRDILENLSGEFSAHRSSGIFVPEYAQRVWNALPQIGQALVEQGAELIGTLLPAEPLNARLDAFTVPGTPCRRRLDDIIRQADARSISQEQQITQITRLLQSLADLHPLILVIDDLQWADPASLNLLYHLGQRLQHHRVLIIGAYRSHSASDVLQQIVREFQRRTNQPPLDLDRCDGRAFITALLDYQGYRVSDDFREALYRQTGGQALFTVDTLTAMQRTRQIVQDTDGHWVVSPTLNWHTIPNRVEAILSDEYHRLPSAVHPLLKIVSILGEHAAARVIASIAGMDETQVNQLLGALPGGELAWLQVRMPAIIRGSVSQVFYFRHRLYREFVFRQISPGERAILHGKAAQALVETYGDKRKEIAVKIAYHYEQAHDLDAAIPCLLAAARYAASLSSFEQSIALLSHALELLPSLPPSPERDMRELELLNALSGQLLGGKGWASDERQRTIQRAYELSQQISDASASQFLLTLFSLADMVRARGEYAQSLALGEQMMHLAQTGSNQEYLAITHWTLGETRFYMGDISKARQHLDEVVRLHNPFTESGLTTITGADATIASLCWLSWIATVERRDAHARALGEQAVELARRLAHPFDQAFALLFGQCGVSALQGDWQHILTVMETLMPMLQQDDLMPLLPWGLVYQGWALSRSGDTAQGIALLHTGVNAWQDAGAVSGVTCMNYYLADACLLAGDTETALAIIDNTLEIAQTVGERLFEPALRALKISATA